MDDIGRWWWSYWWRNLNIQISNFKQFISIPELFQSDTNVGKAFEIGKKNSTFVRYMKVELRNLHFSKKSSVGYRKRCIKTISLSWGQVRYFFRMSRSVIAAYSTSPGHSSSYEWSCTHASPEKWTRIICTTISNNHTCPYRVRSTAGYTLTIYIYV